MIAGRTACLITVAPGTGTAAASQPVKQPGDWSAVVPLVKHVKVWCDLAHRVKHLDVA